MFHNSKEQAITIRIDDSMYYGAVKEMIDKLGKKFYVQHGFGKQEWVEGVIYEGNYIGGVI